MFFSQFGFAIPDETKISGSSSNCRIFAVYAPIRRLGSVMLIAGIYVTSSNAITIQM